MIAEARTSALRQQWRSADGSESVNSCGELSLNVGGRSALRQKWRSADGLSRAVVFVIGVVAFQERVAPEIRSDAS